jgi:hypothetical protein
VLHIVEQFQPALLPQHVADQFSQQPHVIP